VLVASAGNDSIDDPIFPAAFPEVISVSAVDITGSRALYSNRGSTIELAASGGNLSLDLNRDGIGDGVLSTMAEYQGPGDYTVDQYIAYQGTSMAAPHVAAAAALLLAAAPGLTSAELRTILQQSAVDLGQTGRDPEYGYGLLNVYEAVRRAQAYPDAPVLDPVLLPRFDQEPFSRRAQLSGTDPAGGFTLANIGGAGTISIDPIAVIPGVPWLTVTPEVTLPAAVHEGDPLQVELQVHSGGIEDGQTRTATLEIPWSSDERSGSEFFYVLYNSAGFFSDYADLGEVYVVAIDYETDLIAKQDITDAGRGFEYRITEMEPGYYYVGASTNLDGDNWIFEPGEEVFGFYPSNAFIQVFDFREGDVLTGIDFPISNTIYGSGQGQ
jgi:serine protease